MDNLFCVKQRSSYVDIKERETCINDLYMRKWRKKTHENVKSINFFSTPPENIA
jgi:hypothetical protein